MDITLLVQLLAPCLPFLLKMGDKAAEKAAEKVGEDTWNKAKAIWEKLHPRLESKDAAKEVIADIVVNPEDEDLRATLRVQLKKILEQDANLAKAIDQILHEPSEPKSSGTQVKQIATGNQNQLMGHMSGSNKAIGSVQGNVNI